MISASPQASHKAWVQDCLSQAYTPDIASEIDAEEEIMAEELGCSIAIAKKVIEKMRQCREDNAGNSRELFAKVISVLLQGHHHKPSLIGLACAGGLDQMNGIRSQAQAARENGGTRAIYSHWTTAWADFLSGKNKKFTITKFRKSESSRETFKEKATDPFTSAKQKAISRKKNQCN